MGRARRAGSSKQVDSHELYDLGHLYEAAVAHYQATGKRTLLDVALKTADLLDQDLRPRQAIDLARPSDHRDGPGQAVSRHRRTSSISTSRSSCSTCAAPTAAQPGARPRLQPVAAARRSTRPKPVGHAVRATYMYSGMADVAALTGDKAYVNAIDRIWDNVVAKKLYITGGIGATGRGEAFGGPYELPNMTAYNETCAAVGNDFWNQRLFLLHADAKYIDVMERTLYNGLISGVSLDGKTFFYPNPLESNGQHQRSPWFGVACCPGNITRFMASVPGYVYAQQGNTLYVNLFAGGTADIVLGGRPVKIAQETRYPWDGDVQIDRDAGPRARSSRSTSACRAGRATSRCRAICIGSSIQSRIRWC